MKSANSAFSKTNLGTHLAVYMEYSLFKPRQQCRQQWVHTGCSEISGSGTTSGNDTVERNKQNSSYNA